MKLTPGTLGQLGGVLLILAGGFGIGLPAILAGGFIGFGRRYRIEADSQYITFIQKGKPEPAGTLDPSGLNEWAHESARMLPNQETVETALIDYANDCMRLDGENIEVWAQPLMLDELIDRAMRGELEREGAKPKRDPAWDHSAPRDYIEWQERHLSEQAEAGATCKRQYGFSGDWPTECDCALCAPNPFHRTMRYPIAMLGEGGKPEIASRDLERAKLAIAREQAKAVEAKIEKHADELVDKVNKLLILPSGTHLMTDSIQRIDVEPEYETIYMNGSDETYRIRTR